MLVVSIPGIDDKVVDTVGGICKHCIVYYISVLALGNIPEGGYRVGGCGTIAIGVGYGVIF